MTDDLNSSPTGCVALIIISTVILIVLIRHRSYLTLDGERIEDKEDNHRDEVVGAHYGAVMQIERH